MTLYFITIVLASFLFGWSLRTTLHLHSPAKEKLAKQMKAYSCEHTRHVHIIALVVGIILVFFLPALWPIVAIAGLYVLIVNPKLSRKEKSLMQEALIQQDKEAIITLNLGYAYNNPDGAALKLWFMPCNGTWPLAKIETGFNCYNLPLEHTRFEHLREHFLPVLAEATRDEREDPMFLGMKNDLISHGITHPIDIQGWDHHPVIRDFIERILSAEPRETTRPQTEEKAA